MRRYILGGALGFMTLASATLLLAPGVRSQQPRLPARSAAVTPRPDLPTSQRFAPRVPDPKVLVEQLEARVAALEKRVAKLEAYKTRLATHEHGYLSPYGKRNTDGPEPGVGRGPGLGD